MSQRGSIRRRGSTWTIYWWEPETRAGKPSLRRQRTEGGFRTKGEAQRALNTKLAELQAGTYVEPTKATLRGYLEDQWLAAIATTVRPSTLMGYTLHVRTYIVPRLGGTPLHTLNAPMLNAFYAGLLRDGRAKTGEGLSATSVRRIHATLHRALRDAVRWRLIPFNPADNSDPPKQRQAGSAEINTWTAEQLDCFLARVRDDRDFAAWQILATTGLRRGELLGIRREDVDLSASRLAIRQTLLAVDNKLVYSTPKTRRGRRLVPVPATTIASLRAHLKRQAEERLAWGPAYEDNGLVFTRENGAPIHPDSFSQTFDRHVRQAGLPRITVHGLRHSWATLALEAGVPVKVVSEILGHSTHSFTADIYQHAVPALQEDAVERVATLISRGKVDNALTSEA